MGKIRDLFTGITLAQEAHRQVLTADKLYSELEARAQNLETQLLKANAELNPQRRENDQLKQKIIQLESSQKQPELRFDETTGTYINQAGGPRYCAKCKSSDKLSPLVNGEHAWRCVVCNTGFRDPSRPYPTVESDYNPFP